MAASSSSMTSLSFLPLDITGSYLECVHLYKRLFGHLTRSPNSGVLSSNLNVEKALDQYVRLRSWGEESRAILPADSRGSLDDVLRDNSTLKPIVSDVLRKIKRQIDHVLKMIQINDSPAERHGLVGFSQTDDSDRSDTSSEDESFGTESHMLLTKRSSTRIFANIGEDIDSLYQVLLMIDRPGYSRHYIHSTKNDGSDYGSSSYAYYDLRHIEDKIHSWTQNFLAIGAGNVGSAVGNEIPVTSSLDPMKSKILILRLARANTKRRQQLEHWQDNPDKAFDLNTSAADDATEQSMPAEPQVENTREISTAKSVISKETFSKVAVSDLFDKKTVVGPPRTIYTNSTGFQSSNRVPKVPSTAFLQKEFECPYCRLHLDSERMQNRQEWKRHMFRDLRPYSCTFSECQNPEKLYATRRDWIYHEMQMHWRQWVCEEHGGIFHSREDALKHIAVAHNGLSQHQTAMLIEMWERQLDNMELVSCPLCPSQRRLQIMHSHIAQHLESIALFVIPGDDNEEEEEETDESDEADLKDATAAVLMSTRIVSEHEELPKDLQKETIKHEENGEESQSLWYRFEDIVAQIGAIPHTSTKARERYEEEKRIIMGSYFSQANKAANGPYVFHVNVVEYINSRTTPPPASGDRSSAQRTLIIAVDIPESKAFLHKCRKNSKGRFVMISSWDLLNLTEIDNFVHKQPQSEQETKEIILAGNTGFLLRLPKTYYWEASEESMKQFFLETLVKLYHRYTQNNEFDEGTYPILEGFSAEELDKLTDGRPYAATEEGRAAWKERNQDPGAYRSRLALSGTGSNNFVLDLSKLSNEGPAVKFKGVACTFPGCDKAFDRVDDFRSHQKTHMYHPQRPHVCSVCQEGYLTPKDLERHQFIMKHYERDR
ncbi:unnamed protein product [Periconia digitata]|uniref:C2H2-type domain-containing protein n=1 Tax=Periconia digitata TaxID=1303443 RepID=A0A9W4U4L1_9PLEO|nr:unnamed protein product [Periconia digitata]